MMLLEPEVVVARTATTASPAGIEMVSGTSLFRKSYKRGRPNYKAYRGNSRHKMKKLGVYKRWRLRVKAQKKKRNRVLSPSVKVGVPVRTLKK
ncbi:hypothetical protein [Hymenobacter metallilatus]|uniref:Uncharacterized protein n=1 Tax=Hymenobacter metallilatus TaxID=2493666 RepID=A0A3R9UGV5_9BACT|nr:hypothetical protein [Hymenobacter metallilatus]RSK31203.1 hypothetical protein EI290_14385 [Hymenobacter metallilatus]